jgi:hypothetical protein
MTPLPMTMTCMTWGSLAGFIIGYSARLNPRLLDGDGARDD